MQSFFAMLVLVFSTSAWAEITEFDDLIKESMSSQKALHKYLQNQIHDGEVAKVPKKPNFKETGEILLGKPAVENIVSMTTERAEKRRLSKSKTKPLEGQNFKRLSEEITEAK